MAHTTERWAAGFLQQLARATRLSDELSFVQVGWGSNVRLVGLRSDFTHLKEDVLTAYYARSDRRLLLFDYDGTITTTAQKLPPPTDEVLASLKTLSNDPRNTVFSVSGRQRKQLGQWFHALPQLGIAAEKGCYVRWPQRMRALMGTRTPKAPPPVVRAATSKSGSSSGSAHDRKDSDAKASSSSKPLPDEVRAACAV
jgi:hypothetical protein